MRIKRLISIFTAILCVFSMFGCSKETTEEAAETEYSENVNAIAYYFDKLQPIERVYFKSEPIGDGKLGPSSFSIVGFICISEQKMHTICNTFDFVEKEPEFQEGISPDITGYTDFTWKTNYDFSKELLEGNFIGEVYLDIDNNVIYINVEKA